MFLIHLPHDLLVLIVQHCGPIEHQIIRFLNKQLHRLVHHVGQANLLEFLWDCPTGILNVVAEKGTVDQFKFFREIGAYWCENTCDNVAIRGWFDVFKWMIEQKCVYGTTVTGAAAMSGNLDLLKWTIDHCGNLTAYVIRSAAHANHFEIVKFLFYEKETKLLPSLCDHAAKHGNKIMLEWLIQNCATIDSFTMKAAATAGKMEIIEYLIEKNCIFDTETIIQSAAHNGYFEIVKWLYKRNRCTLGLTTFQHAVYGGNLRLIQWLKKKNCPVDDEVCSGAAHKNDLELLKYLRSHKFPWNNSVCRLATENGNLEMLKWAIDNGCDVDLATCVNVAAAKGNFRILKFLVLEKGVQFNDKSTCEAVASSGNLEMLKWFHEKGCKWDATAFSEASASGHLNIVKYLHENGFEWNYKTILYATNNRYLSIVKYAVENGLIFEPSIIAQLNKYECDKIKKSKQWFESNSCGELYNKLIVGFPS